MKNKVAELLNIVIGLLGIIIIAVGISLSEYSILMTILLSIGTSLVASSIVSWLNAKYLVKNENIKILLTKWQILSLYKTKAEMNVDSNEALESCKKSLDIIAEGMHNFILTQDVLLRRKIKSGVKIRIISCDNTAVLLERKKDESINGSYGDSDPGEYIRQLNDWIKNIRNDYPNCKIEIRYHSSYPSLSYMKADSTVFISPNLWLRPSQQSFALSFTEEGIGGKYFSGYFEELWNSSWFVHENCKL